MYWWLRLLVIVRDICIEVGVGVWLSRIGVPGLVRVGVGDGVNDMVSGGVGVAHST